MQLLESQASRCAKEPGLLLPGTAAMQIGLNAYYLQEEATRAIRRGEVPAAVVEEVFVKAKRLGATFIRTWAFNEAADKVGDSAIQVAKLAYDETALAGFDLVLERATAHGIKLILPLCNYWNAYGGTRRYVAWAQLAAPVEGDPRFFTVRDVVEHYKEHLGRFLERTSTRDGLRIGDHPAVLAWELMNEPRGNGLDDEGHDLRAWIDEIAAHVKSLAPAHLVGTGEEGFTPSGTNSVDDAYWQGVGPSWLFSRGSNFELNTASPHTDYASIHWFPEAWEINRPDIASAGARWISEHMATARRLGKPLLVGEFGLRNDDEFALLARRALYRGWLTCARRTGAAAIAPWGFAHDSRPDTWDRYTFYLRDDTDSTDPVNRYADLIEQAASMDDSS